MSKNIVFEGWLTKSPPTKRIWRAKWRRRWFALRQSGELPGQYFLDYYADRNCRRLKGTINLDLCEQVDAGLHMLRSGSSPLAPRLRGSVFSVRTQSRTYHLEADCEDDMEKWVHAICQVCHLRSTEDAPKDGESPPTNDIPLEVMDSSGGSPYIPISECITGARNQVMGFDKGPGSSRAVVTTQPRPTTELSENESNPSDEEIKSLNIAQPAVLHVLGDWKVARSFTKLKINQNPNGLRYPGPPVPPRPQKTFAMTRADMMNREAAMVHAASAREPASSNINIQIRPSSPWRMGGRRCYSRVQTSPVRRLPSCMEDEDMLPAQHTYLNLITLPPAVDRALKPRHMSEGHIHSLLNGGMKSDVLHYIDLDLHTPKPEPKGNGDVSKQEPVQVHGKSPSTIEPKCEYHTIDFIKTEAFNIMCKDAKASRLLPYSSIRY